MANPTTNFGWVMPTATDLVTDLPADFNVFGQAVDTSMAQLKGGTTGQILSKTSATDMAFTWITNDVGDITAVTAGTGISGGGTSGAVTVTNSMATAITTAGDVIQGTGSATFSRLGIGTVGQVLTVNSGATALEYATPTSGGMTSLNSTGTTLSGSSTVISITTTGYAQLVIYVINAYASAGGLDFFVRLNGDSGSNYTYQNNISIEGATYGQAGTGATSFKLGNIGNVNDFDNNSMAHLEIARPDKTEYKVIDYVCRSRSATEGLTTQGAVAYNSTTAISSITFLPSSGTFTAGTVFIYGVK